MPNLILFLASILILFTVGLLWLRHALLQEFSELKTAQQHLKKDCEIERDRTPRLLEALREEALTGEAWTQILHGRAALLDRCTLQEALNFHTQLQDFLQKNQAKGLHFLEVKKELETLNRSIDVGQKHVSMRLEIFEAKRKQFPFSIASGIFGFQKIGNSI